jgi:ribosomal subunit interface protein
MTFPRISTKALNIELTPQIETLLEQKFTPLGKFLEEHDDSHCEIELEKVAEHQSGKIHRVEVNLHNNGKLFRVEATEEQFETAIDSARDELKSELIHFNGKRQSLVRRGSQEFKKLIQTA